MNQENQKPSPNDTGFLVVTAALMVMIMALLAGLWLKTTWRARAAEAQAARRQTELDQIRMFLQAKPLIPAINRDDLPAREVVLDGKRVRALRLPAGVAEQIGLKPGDVVLVGKAPATAPSTRQELPKSPVTD